MSAARTFRQLKTVSSRLSSRQLSSVSLRRLPLAAAKFSSPAVCARAFSVSARSLKAGSTDVALSQKLTEELKYEHEVQDGADAAESEFLTQFRANGIWKVEDTPGNNEVTLSRHFGNESIRLVFSISDLQTQDPEEGFDEDNEEDGERGEEDEPRDDIIRVVLSITKSTDVGALDVELTAQGGHFLVENISYSPDAKTSQETSVEADWKRRGQYIGPEFSTLDVGVQEDFEKFLEERDVNETTAFFIPAYAKYKEQREYMHWLENVKKFIDA
ncbi:mitochondrial glycoprotein [Mycena maculata]|uniref:Mitochondrial glycoprotein n=1 Tax=Mycena maculata TaxID=230809 RepID=A0AAD7MT62_9AGAR|nr:mitochondrial glycoprotein [Mycena maculata]